MFSDGSAHAAAHLLNRHVRAQIMTAPPPTLRAVFERAASPNSLAWRDVRLSPDGVATFTAVAVADADMGICSVLMGADCHTGHTTCCYCLDEFVAGALFDTGRQRVVTWSPHEAGFLALHVLSIDVICRIGHTQARRDLR